jgi:hypothetical protein
MTTGSRNKASGLDLQEDKFLASEPATGWLGCSEEEQVASSQTLAASKQKLASY